MSRRVALSTAAGLLFATLTGATCTTFQEPSLGSCGNHVFEPELEDCDGNSDASFTCRDDCHWACNSSHQCPVGFQCDSSVDGVDGVCHLPQGEFVETVHDLASLSSDGTSFRRVSALLAADLDGVAPSELIVQAGDRYEEGADTENSLFVARFDRAAVVTSLRREQTGLKLNAPVSAAPNVLDGTSELVVAPHPRVPGALTLRGLPESSPTPASLLPGLASEWGGLTAGARLSPGTRQNDQGTFGFTLVLDNAQSSFAYDSALFGPLPGYVVESPLLARFDGEIAAKAIAVHAAHGRLHQGAKQFESLVVALRLPNGDDEVRIYPSDSIQFAAYTTVALPFGQKLDLSGGVWLEKVDDDDLLDLLVTTEGGDTYLAHGAGDGAFSSTATLSPIDNVFEPTPFILGTHPLAVGLIDGDQRADFVFRDAGVALSAGDGVGDLLSACPVIQSSVAYVCGAHGGTVSPGGFASWDSALVADLNDDDRLDIVVTDQNSVDVFYSDYAPGGEALLLEHRIPTPSQPHAVAVADVDGDLLGDIVFAVRENGVDSLFAAFGAAQGGPEPPIKIFDAEEIVDVKAVSNGRDLYVLSRDGGEDLRWSFVPKRTDRHLSAPLLLPCLQRLGDGDGVVPQQLAAGHFLDPNAVDVALLYEDCFASPSSGASDRLVLVPGTPNGGLAPVLDEPLDGSACAGGIPSCQGARRAMQPTSVELSTPPGWSRDSLLRATDLDGDQRDELIVIGPGEDGETGRLLVLRSDGAAPPRFEVTMDATLDLPFASASGNAEAAQVADVDGDGLSDVVLLTSAGTLAVIPGSADSAAPLSVQDLVVLERADGAGEGEILSFSLLDANGDGLNDDVLFIVGKPALGMLPAQTKIVLAHIDADQARLEGVDFRTSSNVGPTEASQGKVVPGENVTRIIAADFDGDRLVDYAISDGTLVRVYRSVAVHP